VVDRHFDCDGFFALFCFVLFYYILVCHPRKQPDVVQQRRPLNLDYGPTNDGLCNFFFFFLHFFYTTNSLPLDDMMQGKNKKNTSNQTHNSLFFTRAGRQVNTVQWSLHLLSSSHRILFSYDAENIGISSSGVQGTQR